MNMTCLKFSPLVYSKSFTIEYRNFKKEAFSPSPTVFSKSFIPRSFSEVLAHPQGL